MDRTTLPPDGGSGNIEDYTGSFCLLLPKGKYTLIDADDYDKVARMKWRLLGRNIYFAEMLGTKNGRRRYYPWSIHRWIMDLPPARLRRQQQDVDHINRNPFDNRKANLRVCTRSENAMNRPGRADASSKYKGVSWIKSQKRWRAHARFEGKRYHLGTFRHEEHAALAYNNFIKKACPAFGFLNPIEATPDSQPFPAKRRRPRRRHKSLSETPEGNSGT